MTATKVYIDFETKSELDLKEVGAALYSEHPSTDALCVGIQSHKFGTTAVSLRPEEFYEEGRNAWLDFWANDPNTIFIAHNAIFEIWIWENVMVKKYGYPRIPLDRWRCTMAKSYACGLPGKLKDIAKVLDLPVQKDMDGRDNMLSLSKPKKPRKLTLSNIKALCKKSGIEIPKDRKKDFDYLSQQPEIIELFNKTKFWTPEEKPEKFQKLYDYCITDVEVCKLIDEALPDLLPEEQYTWQLDQQMNMSGIYIDRTTVEIITSHIDRYNSNMLEEFQLITGFESPRQRALLLEWLQKNGLDIDNTQKATLAVVTSEDANVSRVLEIAKELGKSSTAKYYTMLEMSEHTGLIREIDQYHAAHTGRWGGRGVQFQNLPRSKALIDIADLHTHTYDGLIAKHPDLMVALSSILRNMLVPPPQYDSLIVGDFAQMEARVLAWLANEQSVLEAFRTGEDLYCLEASKIFGYEVQPHMKDERQVGKTAVLALGYGGGIGAFGNMARLLGVDLTAVSESVYVGATETEQQLAERSYERHLELADDPLPEDEAVCADIIKQRWRQNNPNIVKFWKQLEYGAKHTLETGIPTYNWVLENQFLSVILPSGRRMRYPCPNITDKRLTYYNHKARETGYREETHGGKLAENVTQAVQRDLLRDAYIRIAEQIRLPYFHVHDEIVLCGTEQEKFTQLMKAVPEWAFNLPIDVDVKVVSRYEK